MTFTGKYILRKVLGDYFVVPVDRGLGEGRKCFELSAEGADIWHMIEHGGDLSMYDEEDIREFVGMLKSLDALA